ncbi:MAG: DUF916 and DUF3324 domain-containing protein [Oscillospiraceae bacterium]|nr:DUF916 and DUF3324 domain-containing protein [Oscillospiraceae bacterium]
MFKKLIMALSLLFSAVFGLLPGFAMQVRAEDPGGIGYYVRAVLPDNQIDDTLTYFDLRMTPGQTQTLEVEIVNETDEAIVVDLSVISASTNRNGVIDYKTPGIRDKTLKIPFSDIASPQSSSITVEPLSASRAMVTITMPDTVYDGVVLGGLVFSRQGNSRSDGSGMLLRNIYSYVIGVKLSETETAVVPEFELDGIQAQLVNYQPSMVHYIRNKAAAIAKNITLDVTVYDHNGNPAARIHKTGVDMAPNSVMPLAVTANAPQDASGGDSAALAGGSLESVDPGGIDSVLAPGDYTCEVKIRHQDITHTFRQAFTIGSVEAQQINGSAISTALKQSEPEPDTNNMMKLLLILAAVIIIALILLLIILFILMVRDHNHDSKSAK